jgi:hypothetical protein
MSAKALFKKEVRVADRLRARGVGPGLRIDTIGRICYHYRRMQGVKERAASAVRRADRLQSRERSV